MRLLTITSIVTSAIVVMTELACTAAPAEPTQDINATVEVFVQELSFEATVEALVKKEIASQATPTPTPTNTQVPTAIPTPTSRPTPTPRPTVTPTRRFSSPPQSKIDVSAEITATISTNHGNIKIQLFPGQAPITVNNFVFLASWGFYNGLIFHRVIDGFMIQGGDPEGKGTGNPGYHFQDEINASLAFDQAGKLAMANAGPNTNGSQFFITTAEVPHLTGSHTIFGQVIEGQSVVNDISRVPTNQADRPWVPVTIDNIDIVSTSAKTVP